MSEKLLPVYQIQNFKEPSGQHHHFYLNDLATHLQKHAFIQKPHKHDFYILVFITRGSGTHTIDFQNYPVAPDSVFFLTPGQVHAWQLSADTEGYVIFFSQEFYVLGYPQKKLFQFPFFNVLLQRPLLTLSETEMRAASEIIGQLKEEHESRQWKHEDILLDLLDILLIRLARNYQEKYAGSISSKAVFNELQQLENRIDQHFKEHKPVSFYAEELHLTTKQLNDMCKQALGKTTTELIQDRIILEARRLLTHSDLTITQIAAELGYFDNSYFTRFFKKHTSQTPEQFRQSLE